MDSNRHGSIAAAAVLAAAALFPGLALAQTHTRTDVIEYHDDLNDWVIGQPRKSTYHAPDGSKHVEYEHVYDAMGSPIQSFAFDKLQHKASYHADGTLASLSDGRDSASFDTTVSYSQWKRGIPQRIAAPDGTVRTAVVDGLGQILSATDEAGAKTCYAYDAMGRLSKITYPSETQAGVCDTSAWAPTTIAFSRGHPAIYGLPAGHWRHQVQTGNGRKLLFFDALWRPVVEQETDVSKLADTTSEVVRRYDAHGRVVFASHAMNTVGTAVHTDPALKGTRTTYDALGRVTQQTQDSELGPLVTKTEYLAGFKSRTTNPRGFATTTSYYAWDAPSTAYPRNIAHPESAVTNIVRDVFGKPLSITRRDAANTIGQTRHWAYNAHQELCERTEAETGTTVMHYDAAGNLAWSASGLPSSDPARCDDVAVPESQVVTRTYDQRNRLRTVRFPDQRGDTTHTYTPTGLLQSLVADNGAGETVTQAYAYNKRGLQTSERLQHGAVHWLVRHGYNANGHRATLSYPKVAFDVEFRPDARGRATLVGFVGNTPAAWAAYYHPNGVLRTYLYGNGARHETTLNLRGLPERRRNTHTNGTVALVDESIDYDGNANVMAISDGTPGAPTNRDMTYDGLDRLKSVVSPMYGAGGAHYTYDVLDNLTRVVGPGRDHHHCYDARWQLTNIKTGSCSGPSVIGMGYDAQGNRINKNGAVYDFDVGSRLRSATVDGVTSTYAYDGHGRRVRATSTADIHSMYGLDGALIYQEDHKRGKRIYHLALAGRTVNQVEVDIATGVAANRYQHSDLLGSPLVVTNGPHHELERSSYEPFGKLLNRPLGDGPNYTGHVGDAATGLLYMQQRYFDSACGCFVSVDPVGADETTGDNFNRYRYANGNPYRYVDPDGRFAWLAVPILFGGSLFLTSEPANAPAVGEATVPRMGAGESVSTLLPPARALAPLKVAASVSSKSAPAAHPNAPRETGSYTNTHQSGMTYDGKGSRQRSQESGRRVERETKDPHVATDWTPAGNSRDAFKQESQRLDSHGGPGSASNHNKIESPGRRMREEDLE